MRKTTSAGPKSREGQQIRLEFYFEISWAPEGRKQPQSKIFKNQEYMENGWKWNMDEILNIQWNQISSMFIHVPFTSWTWMKFGLWCFNLRVLLFGVALQPFNGTGVADWWACGGHLWTTCFSAAGIRCLVQLRPEGGHLKIGGTES